MVRGLPAGRPGRPIVMGVVNVTPDSFSDGGAWFDPDTALAHGRRPVSLAGDCCAALGMVAGLNEVNPDITTVEEAMTQEAYTVSKDTPLFAVLEEMLEHKYGSVVVVEGVKIVGILTTHDALKLLVDNFGRA